MALPSITGEFRVATEPALRFAPSGMAVCNIRTVASKQKKQDNGEWVDDKFCWVTLTGFKKQAENMAESFKVGDLVLVTGTIQTEDYEDREGNKRTSVSVIVDNMGHATKWDPSTSMKADRPSGGQSSGGQQSRPAPANPADNPWVDHTAAAGDDPPF